MTESTHDLSRAELLEKVIVAVDAAAGEAEALGDENYLRHCREVIFPFLYSELRTAEDS